MISFVTTASLDLSCAASEAEMLNRDCGGSTRMPAIRAMPSRIGARSRVGATATEPGNAIIPR
jgi:hypothetical protein